MTSIFSASARGRLALRTGFSFVLTLLTALVAATPATTQAALITLPTPPLRVGCPWIPSAIDSGNQNSGYPDKNGNYSMAALPSYPDVGTTLVIHGQYPQVRYFSFQIADRDTTTPPNDQISDSDLIPDQGGTPSSNVAQLPFDGNYTQSYTITVRFEDVPASREPNTLYAGVPTNPNAIKQLLMRNYLGNPGTDAFGNTPLPSLTLITAQGSTNLNNTSDVHACAAYKASWTQTQAVFIPLGAPRPLIFFPSTGSGLVLYPNGDSHYIGAITKETMNDMVVLRSKAPAFPPVPPVTIDNPDVRYWSVCQNEEQTTASVACIADRNVVLEDDGYFTVVVSPDAKKPDDSLLAQGYNWLPWGNSFDALLVLRQIFPRPDFAGNYLLAINDPNDPLSTTIGEWAPDITYCDSKTFAANAAAGGVALMAACHQATDTLLAHKPGGMTNPRNK